MTDTAIKELLSPAVSLPHLDLLHYLLSESDGQHIAHCLDLDLAATAETRRAAAHKLDRLVKPLSSSPWQLSNTQILPQKRRRISGTNLRLVIQSN
jgi:hypothetical protein